MKKLARCSCLPIVLSVFFFTSYSQSHTASLARAAFATSGDSLEIELAEALNRSDLPLADRILHIQLMLDSNAIQWNFFRGMRSFIEISYDQSGQNDKNLEKVRDAMQRTIEIGEKILETNPSDSVALFYTGGAYGYLGIAQLQSGSMFKAGATAKRGFQYHEKLIELCPAYYDAYLGPGMKNLMVAAVPWVLKPLLFLLGLTGTEERAKEYLTLAYERGRCVHLEAGNYLAQVYERRKEWDKCRAIYAELLDRYPYRVGICLESLQPLYAENRYDEIIDRCKQMMARYELDGHVFTRSDSMRVKFIVSSRAGALKKLGRGNEAIELYRQVLTNKAYQGSDEWYFQWSLGSANRDEQRYPEAKECYLEALRVAPEKSRKGIQKDLDNLPSMP